MGLQALPMATMQMAGEMNTSATSSMMYMAVPRVTHDAVARRAYEIYLWTGRKSGRCEDNWAQAERDLRGQDKGGE